MTKSLMMMVTRIFGSKKKRKNNLKSRLMAASMGTKVTVVDEVGTVVELEDEVSL